MRTFGCGGKLLVGFGLGEIFRFRGLDNDSEGIRRVPARESFLRLRVESVVGYREMKHFERQNFPRFYWIVFLTSVLAVPVSVTAQQAAASSAGTGKIPVKGLPVDAIKIVTAMKDSYYRPDDLSGLSCTVSVDWGSFFTATKQTPSADRLKTLQGVKIHSEAVRGQKTEVTFDWAGGTLDTKDQVEGGIKQMVSGFYEMYWPMMATFPIGNASEIKEIVPQADGGTLLSLPTEAMKVSFKVDKDNVPTNFSFDSAMMKGSADLSYQPSPNPIPGDLRRISGLKVSEVIGTSNINVDIGVDYQTVGGFHIPKHLNFGLGTISIGMDFSDCSVSKKIEVGPPAK
jgi:hypothetical protein